MTDRDFTELVLDLDSDMYLSEDKTFLLSLDTDDFTGTNFTQWTDSTN